MQGRGGLQDLQNNNGRSEDSATSRTAQGQKWRRVLRAFLDRGVRGYNRFEAERELNDHVLPTTVSQLEARGVRISRRIETVPGFQGAPTDCARYWIAPEALQRARELLGLPAHPGERQERHSAAEATNL